MAFSVIQGQEFLPHNNGMGQSLPPLSTSFNFPVTSSSSAPPVNDHRPAIQYYPTINSTPSPNHNTQIVPSVQFDSANNGKFHIKNCLLPTLHGMWANRENCKSSKSISYWRYVI